ncbi:MAG: polyprenyl diphosphate synthase [Gammaproteobacteria bacterium]
MKTPDAEAPRHIAVIMDGSGRWAQQNGLPRLEGHRRGLDAARELVENCLRHNIAYLTLFAFSRENWQRPAGEVSGLMRLFAGMHKWQNKLLDAGVRLMFIGERGRFSPQLQKLMTQMETATAGGGKITVVIAAGYSGQWDILQAAKQLGDAGLECSEENFAARLATGLLPPPDLLIRSGGEQRISNFMLWQLSYSELYFTDVLWPDFSARDLQTALDNYAGRERRYGRVRDD